MDWYETTTPKLGPALRRVQNKSEFCVAERTVMVPFASTTVMAAMPLTARAHLWELMP